MRFRNYLFVLFIVVPVIELFVLFKVGKQIGVIETFVIIIVTGIIGAHLAKQQGITTLTKIRASLQQGKLPGNEIVDGLIILVAGAVLLTPGFLTDIFGFLLLLPAGRSVLKLWLIKKFQKFIKEGSNRTTRSQFSFRVSSNLNRISEPKKDDDVIDIEARSVD